MFSLTFQNTQPPIQTVLCLGAHSDDIEIGCGGTMLRLIEENPQLHVCWVVFSADPQRTKEALSSANKFLRKLPTKRIFVKAFADGYLPAAGNEIKQFFEELKETINPDLIFTHCREDRHQDHRLIHELTWNTFRHHLILEYEVPKYDGDLGTPNFFFHLTPPLCQRKVDHLMDHFATQNKKPWFTPDTFLGLARLRGIESRSPNHYAEAFYCRKMVV